MQYKKFTAEEKKAFAEAYANGVVLKDLAAQAGVSIPTMAKYVRAGGANVRRPGVAKRETGDAMKIVEQVNEIMAQTRTAEVETTVAAPTRTILSFE